MNGVNEVACDPLLVRRYGGAYHNGVNTSSRIEIVRWGNP